MRKLLKLFAIGMLLAVGPIQAFAAVGDRSDELLIKNATGAVVADFIFVEGTEGDRLPGTTWSNTNAIIFNSDLTGTPTDVTATKKDFFLSLTESPEFSDTLRAHFEHPAGHSFHVTISFFDGPPTPSPEDVEGSMLTSKSEATFNTLQDVTHSLGLNGSGLAVMFESDPLAIPEPEIYAMMGIGLALMGFVARRKKLKEGATARVASGRL